MAKLTSKSRNLLDRSQFASPGERKYPIPDKPTKGKADAAGKAKAGAVGGKLSPKSAAKVKAKVNQVLKGC